MSAVVIHQILNQLEGMPESLQIKVLEFIEGLRDTLPVGVSGKALVAFSGAFPPDDLPLMSRVIEEGCERIDHNEW